MAHARSARLLALVAFCLLAACSASPLGEDVGQTAQALETYPNEQPAFDYFRTKGLTAEQSAGIIGNLDVESGLDPAIEQKGGPGRGIAQWSAGARWDTTPGDNVKAYALQQGKSAVSLQLQLDFIWFELTTFASYGLAKLKATTTISAAASSFATNYEGCGSCSSSARVAHAQSVFDRFSGTPVPDAGSASGQPANACTVHTTGDVGVCITTSACATLGDHVSTPGFCPGADDVQCCTARGGGPSTPRDGGTSPGDDADASGCSAAPAADRGQVPWLVGGVALLIAARRRRRPTARDRVAAL